MDHLEFPLCDVMLRSGRTKGSCKQQKVADTRFIGRPFIKARLPVIGTHHHKQRVYWLTMFVSHLQSKILITHECIEDLRIVAQWNYHIWKIWVILFS